MVDPQGWTFDWMSVHADDALSDQLNALKATEQVFIERGALGLEVRLTHSDGRSCTLRRGT